MKPAANPKYRGVMFDLDGTLLDTIADLADSVNAALEFEGLPTRSLDYYRKAVGDGAETMVFRCLPEDRRDGETLNRVYARTLIEYGRHWNKKTGPYPGIAGMLDALSGSGVAICILSNKHHDFTVRVVDEFLSDWDFTVVRGARADVPIKPDPQAAVEIAAECGIAPEDWLYVGDTDTDMQTANAAGLFAIGVTWGFRDADELRDNGADLIVDNPAQIARLALDTDVQP